MGREIRMKPATGPVNMSSIPRLRIFKRRDFEGSLTFPPPSPHKCLQVLLLLSEELALLFLLKNKRGEVKEKVRGWGGIKDKDCEVP